MNLDIETVWWIIGGAFLVIMLLVAWSHYDNGRG